MKYLTKKSLISFFALSLFGIAGLAIWSSVQSKNVARVIIENKTRSLNVESVKESDENDELSRFEVTVKNNYDKPISVLRFRIIDDSTKKNDVNAIERGGLTDGWSLKPNETSVVKFSADKNGKVFLTIAAVLFEDGTGDGVNSDLTLLQDIREGVLLGFQKVIYVLKEETKTGELLASEAAIEELKNKVEQIDESKIPNVSKRGFATAKGFIKFEIEDLKEKIKSESDFNVKNELLKKIDKMESRISTLSVKPLSSNAEKGGKNEN